MTGSMISCRVIPTKTYFLEMTAEPPLPLAPLQANLRCELWQHPDVVEYRTMFRDVGGPWGWTGRLLRTSDEVQAILEDPRNFVYRLYEGTTLIGFFELDARSKGEVEISYVGLLESFVGQGFGAQLLAEAVRTAWRLGPARVCVHTCQWDHPKALRAYQRSGFTVYDEKILDEPYPVDFLKDRGAL